MSNLSGINRVTQISDGRIKRKNKQNMASSRLEKIGNIYTRVQGLIRAGAMRWEDRPLFYDIYTAFPPLKEHKFMEDAPVMNVREIFYAEDKERAEHDYTNMPAFNMYAPLESKKMTFLSTKIKDEDFALLTEEFKKNMCIDSDSLSLYIQPENKLGFLLFVNPKTIKLTGVNYSSLLKVNYPEEGIDCFVCGEPLHEGQYSPVVHLFDGLCHRPGLRNTAARIKQKFLCPYGIDVCDVSEMSSSEFHDHISIHHPEATGEPKPNYQRAASKMVKAIKLNTMGPIYLSRGGCDNIIADKTLSLSRRNFKKRD